MDRVAELVLPTASLLTALFAVSLWRRPPRPPELIDSPDDAAEPGALAPDGVDVPALSVEASWGVLRLSDTQMVGVWLESGDLVIDLFGGDGAWRGYAGRDCVEQGQVAGTAMLTLRASFADQVDLAALERMEGWCEDGGMVDLEMEVDGPNPLGQPRRILLGNGRQSVALLAST